MTVNRAQDREFEEKLARHLKMIEECASAIAAEARSQHYGAEVDDLIQEGRIALWTAPGSVCQDEGSLERYILHRMDDYVLFLGKQRGAARGPSKDYDLQ